MTLNLDPIGSESNLFYSNINPHTSRLYPEKCCGYSAIYSIHYHLKIPFPLPSN